MFNLFLTGCIGPEIVQTNW